MPIEKDMFQIAKDPSNIIMNFLEKDPEKAYTAEEIYASIDQLIELEIPIEKIRETLDYLIRFRDQVETAWVKGNQYYKLKEKYEWQV